jgi:hypothetical protein
MCSVVFYLMTLSVDHTWERLTLWMIDEWTGKDSGGVIILDIRRYVTAVAEKHMRDNMRIFETRTTTQDL